MRLRNHLTLVLGIAMLLAPVAMLAADTVTEPTATSSTATAAAPAATAATAAEATPAADKPTALEQCDMATGSVIRPSKKNGCKSSVSSPTRTYTKQDIERTGEMDLNDALRKLDPRFY